MFTQNRTTIICYAFGLVSLFSCALANASDGERHITAQDDVTSAKLITLNVPAGDVLITGISGNTLSVDITASCKPIKDKDSCAKLLKELGWSKKVGAATEFGLSPSGITHYDDVTIQVKLSVPKDKKLEVNLSAGELRIQGTSACLNAEVNAGEIQITLPEAQLASAELVARVGDVNLTTAKTGRVAGDRSLLVGASLEWDKGTGSCHTKASVLAGEVQVTLN